jgi:preprotein translocase subunit SecY
MTNAFSVPSLIASFMGGTSLLIVVGVMLDTMRQIESHLLMRHYDGFLSKGHLRGRR